MKFFKQPNSSVLGMNSRNIDYVYKYNPRHLFSRVDDKVLSKKICQEANIPQPRLIKVYEWFWQIRSFLSDVKDKPPFAIKPSHGFGGGGILIVEGKTEKGWVTSKGLMQDKELVHHVTQILYGVYSIDNTTDTVIIEEKIVQHAFFDALFSKGVADIRVILFKSKPVMAMCRIPTIKSEGKANLSLGAIGVGVNMHTGKLTYAVDKRRSYTVHPDTQQGLLGEKIPHWDTILKICIDIQRVFPLGYIGADLVVDANKGPLVLEVNARPGLEIQNANRQGLGTLLKELE